MFLKQYLVIISKRKRLLTPKTKIKKKSIFNSTSYRLKTIIIKTLNFQISKIKNRKKVNHLTLQLILFKYV